jgi:phosphatase NudJ
VPETSCFVLGVFRDQGRYLVIQERDETWYLPAGRVEDGESLVAALLRETLEEAAQRVSVQGLVGMDHSFRDHPRPHARYRFMFVGRRAAPSPPKDKPDHHSLRAAWMTKDEIAALPLRHPEVIRWIEKVEANAPVLPSGACEWHGPAGTAPRQTV